MALGLALGYVACLLAQNFRRRGEPPVAWSWTPFLGSAIVFGKRPREGLLARRAELGDTFVAVIAGERTAFVVDADAWPKVLREPASRLEFRSTGMDVTEAAFGNNVWFSLTRSAISDGIVQFLLTEETKENI